MTGTRARLVLRAVLATVVVAATACSSSSRSTSPSTASSSPTTSPAAALRCPASAPVQVRNTGTGVAHTLVPITATRLVVCRYGGSSTRASATRADFVVADRRTVAEFERAANALAPVPDEVAFNCPNDDGSAVVAIFADEAHAVTVRIALSGCAFVTNGSRKVLPTVEWRAAVARIQVAGCPARQVDAFASSRTPGTSLDRALVPIDATNVRICRYAPSSDAPAGRLTGFGVLDDGSAARRLVRTANGLHRISPAERFPCALLANEPAWFLTFSDATTSVDVIQLGSNCGHPTNGVVSAIPTPAWNGALVSAAVMR